MTKTMAAALAAILLIAGAADAGVTKGRTNKTGQTTSYGAGSDGDLQRGLSRIFNDLGDGVVKDSRTGLFWEKKSDDGSIHDKDNVYTWGQDLSPYAMNGTMVTTFLAALNTPPCFAGYCDWRIPNITELLSLVNYETWSPATFTAFDTDCTAGCTVTTCSCTFSNYYWSSSTPRFLPAYAWYVYFGNGYDYYANKFDDYSVRAVRGGS